MKKRLPLLTMLLIAAMLLVPGIQAQEAAQLQINSTRYIVIDAATGEIYAQKDAHKPVAIASLTKVFTAVEALNMAPLDMKFTTSDFDLRPSNATTMGIGPGETYTLKDLLYGLMLPSGNDAAYTIARTLGHQPGLTEQQSVDRFVGLMNRRAADMGLKETHLVNPDGWGVKGHQSSAADVAAFMDYAQKYPILMDIIATPSFTTSNGALTVTNTNKSLSTYPDLIGGKTGVDDDSGWCLVNIAERNGQRMIAVTLDGVAPDDWYHDNTTLLDYGFEQKKLYTSGGKTFSGDHVSWISPDPKQLVASGKSSASVNGVAQKGSGPGREGGEKITKTETKPDADVPIAAEPRLGAPESGSWWVPVAVAGLVVLGAGGMRIARPWNILRHRAHGAGPTPPPAEPSTIESVMLAAATPESPDVTVLEPAPEGQSSLDNKDSPPYPSQ